jgi:predicted RecA/RadA family phage recombinase
MSNNIQGSNSDVEILTAGATYTSGTPAVVGSKFGVPQADAVSGEKFAFKVRGDEYLPAESGVAWDDGDLLYWDDGNGYATKTASTFLFIGKAVGGKLSAASSGRVIYDGIMAIGASRVKAEA